MPDLLGYPWNLTLIKTWLENVCSTCTSLSLSISHKLLSERNRKWKENSFEKQDMDIYYLIHT